MERVVAALGKVSQDRLNPHYTATDQNRETPPVVASPS
jgi:hypothetical protein